MAASGTRSWCAPLARAGLVFAIASALLFPATFHLHIWWEGGPGGDRAMAAFFFALIVHGIALAVSLSLRWIGAISRPDRDDLPTVVIREIITAVLIAGVFAGVVVATSAAHG
jgi:hypothetical protein